MSDLYSRRKNGKSPPWHWKPIDGRLIHGGGVDVARRWAMARRMAGRASYMRGFHVIHATAVDAARYLNCGDED